MARILYTVDQAAERLNTTPRFVRRLVAERRIAFVRLGRHVRIAEDDIDAFIADGRVEPVTIQWRGGRVGSDASPSPLRLPPQAAFRTVACVLHWAERKAAERTDDISYKG